MSFNIVILYVVFPLLFFKQLPQVPPQDNHVELTQPTYLHFFFLFSFIIHKFYDDNIVISLCQDVPSYAINNIHEYTATSH